MSRTRADHRLLRMIRITMAYRRKLQHEEEVTGLYDRASADPPAYETRNTVLPGGPPPPLWLQWRRIRGT